MSDFDYAEQIREECPNATRKEVEAWAQWDDPEVIDSVLDVLAAAGKVEVIFDSRLC